MRMLVISCSLSVASRSAVMARQLADELTKNGDEVRLLDLRSFELPFCDGDSCYSHPNTIDLQKAIKEASAIAIATPIYNYETGGATRNVIALGGQAWNEKVIGFLCAAGGSNSYMSVMPLAASLMLDFRSVIVPRFVYATGSSFGDGRLTDPKIGERISELGRQLQRFAKALSE